MRGNSRRNPCCLPSAVASCCCFPPPVCAGCQWLSLIGSPVLHLPASGAIPDKSLQDRRPPTGSHSYSLILNRIENTAPPWLHQPHLKRSLLSPGSYLIYYKDMTNCILKLVTINGSMHTPVASMHTPDASMYTAVLKVHGPDELTKHCKAS